MRHLSYCNCCGKCNTHQYKHWAALLIKPRTRGERMMHGSAQLKRQGLAALRPAPAPFVIGWRPWPGRGSWLGHPPPVRASGWRRSGRGRGLPGRCGCCLGSLLAGLVKLIRQHLWSCSAFSNLRSFLESIHWFCPYFSCSFAKSLRHLQTAL